MWDYPLHNGEEAKTPEPSAWLFLRVFPKRSCFKVIKNRHRMIGFNFLLNSFARREKKKEIISFRLSQRKVISICRAAYVTQIITETARKGGAGVEVGWMCSRNCRKSKAAEKVKEKKVTDLCIWGPVTQTVCVVWRYTTQLLQSENLLILRGSDFPFTLWFMAYRTVELMQWWQADKSLNIKHQLDIVLFIRVVKNCDFCYFKWCWMR